MKYNSVKSYGTTFTIGCVTLTVYTYANYVNSSGMMSWPYKGIHYQKIGAQSAS